jgi:hypothetical protein
LKASEETSVVVPRQVPPAKRLLPVAPVKPERWCSAAST